MALTGYDEFDPRRQSAIPPPPVAPTPAPPMGAAPLSDSTNRPPHASDDASVPPPPVPEPPIAPILPMSPMSEVASGLGAGAYGAATPTVVPSASGSVSPFSSLGAFGTPPKRPQDAELLRQLTMGLGNG